jgi:hypothetical protein
MFFVGDRDRHRVAAEQKPASTAVARPDPALIAPRRSLGRILDHFFELWRNSAGLSLAGLRHC